MDPDILLKAKGFDLEINLFYNSRSSANGAYGKKRSLSTNCYVLKNEESGNSAQVVRGDEKVYEFTAGSTSGFTTTYSGVSTQYAGTSLVYNSSLDAFIETFPDGKKTVYDKNQGGSPVRYQIGRVEDASGNRHTFTFAYTAGGSPTSLLDHIEDWGGRRWTMMYDGSRQLTTLTTPLGCTTKNSYTGDLLTRMEDPRGFATTYAYDGDNRVASVAAGSGVWTYAYGGPMTWSGSQRQDPPLEMRTTFVWDGTDYLLLNGPTSNTVVLTLGGEIVSSGSFDLLPDSLGSIIGDIRSGQDPRVPFSYWPYGILAESNVKPGFPFLFVGALGYYRDSESRDYVRARELMKATGRWMQVDPYWPEESAFGYCGSSPTNAVDPLGLQVIDPFKQYQQDMNQYINDSVNNAVEKCRELSNCYACLRALYKKYGLIYPGSTGKNNALRHCIGACAARRQCGKECAWAIFGHEIKFWTQDSKYDQFNNHQGFVVADSKLTCFEGCNRLWNAGLLCPPCGNGGGGGSW